MTPGWYCRAFWQRAHEVEKPFATRFDMRAVLDVVRRPQSRRRFVVALIELGIERFKNERLASLFDFGQHVLLLSIQLRTGDVADEACGSAGLKVVRHF